MKIPEGLNQILPVSKLQPVEKMVGWMEANKSAPPIFGENYVFELLEKAKDPRLLTAKFVLIGHLQSNKVTPLIREFSLSPQRLLRIESLDSEKLAKRLSDACDAYWQDTMYQLEVLIQCNVSLETSKGGICSYEEAEQLAIFLNENCPKLSFKGLMTLASTESKESAEADFRKLREWGKALEEKGIVKNCFLSMGTSGDYELAIAHGSNQVRLGTSIFGERENKKEPSSLTQSINLNFQATNIK